MLLWKRIFFASGLSIRWSTGDDVGLLLPWIEPPAALPGLAALPNAPTGFGFNSKPLTQTKRSLFDRRRQTS